MNVFDQYAPFIQDYIYRSGWQLLRGVQRAAGNAIFETESTVLLMAPTATLELGIDIGRLELFHYTLNLPKKSVRIP